MQDAADGLRWAFLAWHAYNARSVLVHVWRLRAVPLVGLTLAVLHLVPTIPGATGGAQTWGHQSRAILGLREVHRTLTGALLHVDILHLATNLLTWCQLGALLEPRAQGTAALLGLLARFAVATSLAEAHVHAALITAAERLGWPAVARWARGTYNTELSVGFSGVLFAADAWCGHPWEHLGRNILLMIILDPHCDHVAHVMGAAVGIAFMHDYETLTWVALGAATAWKWGLLVRRMPPPPRRAQVSLPCARAPPPDFDRATVLEAIERRHLPRSVRGPSRAT